MWHLLRLHGNNSLAKASQCHVVHTSPVSFDKNFDKNFHTLCPTYEINVAATDICFSFHLS
jgi:hypothetical protein